jgi:NAD(P)-dependent dehydrogenase (short-subunit alcohol dehydrogenase family)
MTDALFDISGRVAVVTGGAQGLGRMIAEGFVRAGAEVIITSRHTDAAQTAAAEMMAKVPGARCTGLAADLSTPEAVGELASSVAALVPAVHVLVNNAGRTWGAPLASFPDKAWPGVMAMNVQVPFTLVRDLLPLLRAAALPGNPARVINIGSLAGATVEPISAFSYAASKAALHHLSRVLAAELAQDGISVNTVIPGYFPTKMTAHIRAEAEAHAALTARVPLGRLGTAQDIAGLCIFLASPAGGYITGAELMLDGGMHGCR